MLTAEMIDGHERWRQSYSSL